MGKQKDGDEEEKSNIIPVVRYISNICQLCNKEDHTEINSYVRIEIEPTQNLCKSCVTKLRTLLDL